MLTTKKAKAPNLLEKPLKTARRWQTVNLVFAEETRRAADVPTLCVEFTCLFYKSPIFAYLYYLST